MTQHSIQGSGSITAGTHQTLWTESTIPLEFSKLQESLQTDVVIVGAGIAGMMIAYDLVVRGKKVVVIEDGVIGSGETGRTTAHLTSALDDRYYELQKIFGKEDTKLASQSHKAAIDHFERIIHAENIECDFIRLNGYLFLHPSDKPENLEKEFDAAEQADIEVEIVQHVPGIKKKDVPAICFKNQAQFHPLKFLHGLAEAIRMKGGKIYTNTHALEISSKGISTPEGHIVEADYVVVATNSPVNNKVIMHLKQSNYRTYVNSYLIRKGSLPYALWWDSGDFEKNADVPPYHYVRVHPLDEQHDVLIVGGEDHPVGLIEQGELKEESRYGALESWTREYFDAGQIVSQWSGEVREPVDCLAYIGRNPMDDDNVYIVTGDSGNGMTHGAIAGMLIPDLIDGIDNPWKNIYSPSRLKLSSAGTLIKEFAGGFIQYLKNKPKHTKDVNISEIPNGSARVIELEGKKYGAYRDDADQLHLVSVTCTHMGCTLNWNGDEKSWDCPCHGSRFTHEGVVINGPANTDLAYHREGQSVFSNQHIQSGTERKQ